MLQLAIITLVAAAAGFTVWGVDPRRATYGSLAMPAVAVTATLLVWIGLVAAGVSYTPGISWLAWVAPMVAGSAAAVAAALLIGPRRAREDIARLNAALRV